LPDGRRSAKKERESGQGCHDDDSQQNPIASTAGSTREIQTIRTWHGGAERSGGPQIAGLTGWTKGLNQGLYTHPQHPAITSQGAANKRPAGEFIPMTLLQCFDLASRQTHPLSGLLD
jgi:hypothetical protein